MRHDGVLSLLLGLSAALLLFACSHSSSPTGPADEPYHFDPAPGAISIDALDTFRVKITSRDGGAVSGVFYLDQDSVSTGSSFVWRADRIGQVQVRVVLPPAEAPVVASWMLTVSDANTTPPAPVSLVQASRGALPGSIATSWVRPGTGTQLIDHYRLYYSTAPILEDQLDGIDFAEVDHDSTIIVQSRLLTGLIEKTEYHMRVQVVDILGRGSTLSRESTSLSTGHYRVDGRVTRLKDGGGVEGFPEVLVQVGQYQALSGSDGSYVLDDIPDLSRHPLSMKPTRPLEAYSYYWVVTDTLQLQDQSFDALLFKPLPVVPISATNDSTVFNLDFLYTMTSKVRDGAVPPILRRWETYPIPVRIDADSASTIAGQSVSDAMQNAIQTWNDEAGEELMTPVVGKPAYGADFNIYVTGQSGGGILGEVRMVDPSDSHCLFQCIPRLVVVKVYEQETSNLLDRILVHELGHVLWMAHSPNSDHVMSAGVTSTSPLLPYPEEVRMARLIAHIPNGTDLRWYKFPVAP